MSKAGTPDVSGDKSTGNLLTEQPDFGLEGEVRNPDELTEGRLYTVFNRNHGERRDDFEFLGFPDKINLIDIPERPLEEDERVMRVERRSEDSDWFDGRTTDMFLTDAGLTSYENGWNPANAVVEVADGKVYEIKGVDTSDIGEVAELEGVQVVVPTEYGAEVYTTQPSETEAFADERGASVDGKGYFDSDQLSLEPRGLEDAFEILDGRTSAEEVRETCRHQRNERINGAVERLSAGLVEGLLSAEGGREDIEEVEDIDDVSLEDYEILSERLGTGVSADCAKSNLEWASKTYKEELPGLGIAFYGLSKRSGQIEVDRYLAQPDISEYGEGIVTGIEVQVDLLHGETS